MPIPQHVAERPDGSVNAASDRVIIGNQQVAYNSSAGPIASVTVTVPGSYTDVPVASVTGNGSGAVLAPRLGVLTYAVATPQSGSGSYAPGDTYTATGGTGTAPIFNITHTKVQSATVAAGGTGGTDGTQTVTGTTGTGTKFQASVTVASGAITAVLSITVAGDYTVNPTSLTAEPVTGASLTGAQLSVKMGILTLTNPTPGALTALPTNPVSGTTSGTGTGATLTISAYSLVSVGVTSGGTLYDSSSALALTLAGGGAGTLNLTNTGVSVTVPVVFANLPLNASTVGTYGVFVNPGQDCRWYVQQSSKTSAGFNIVLQPLTGVALSAATLDVSVIA